MSWKAGKQIIIYKNPPAVSGTEDQANENLANWCDLIVGDWMQKQGMRSGNGKWIVQKVHWPCQAKCRLTVILFTNRTREHTTVQ